ncbi:hypothetical protein DI392_19295 [Vibrio albus]|uniref:Uncharacterized protein n=1 Tax=Vibrio albus TaxID=2200953 RepID=A0A2U3B2V9_9VIBR|nr:hypothetical protein [Vibrio albus]PWI31092.1 hypothetical protein DI392_19295 [Vibrio albus]
MDWEGVFRIIIAGLGAVGGAAVIIFGLSSWLGKVWAARILQNEKSQLDQMNFEYQTKFSSLHQKRAEVVAETYSLIRDVYNRVCDYAAHNGNTSENREKVYKSISSLTNYYPKRRIFINKKIATKIDRLRTDLEYIAREVEAEGEEYYSENMYSRIYGQASEALTDLENEFRVLLGEEI